MPTLREILAETEETETVWGPWVIDQRREYLLHDGGPWGIELARFRTAADLGAWATHVAGKGWGDEKCIYWLVRAFVDLNPEDRAF